MERNKGIEEKALKNLNLTVALLLLVPTALATEYFTSYANGTTWTYTLVNVNGQSLARLTRSTGNAASIPTSYSGVLTIPDKLDGFPVTYIGAYAFNACGSITTVNIPNGVKTIEAYAFRQCTNLSDITIPASITNIVSTSFNGCSGITHVGASQTVCSRSVREIFPTAYTNIVSVTIGSDVNSLSSGVFRKLSALRSFAIDSANTSYTVVNNMLLSKDGTTLVRGVNGAVTIPNSVTKIANYAFYELPNLTSVSIGPGVSEIGSIAFVDCIHLMSFAVADENATFTSSNRLLLSKDKTRLIGGVNGAVVIPNTVTEISSPAFGGCANLTSVEIPSSVQKIGQAAFEGCSHLESVSIPSGVKTISGQTFYGCTNLKRVNIPDSVTSINGMAFCDCSSLASITLPSALNSIPFDAFSGCTSLRDILIPASVNYIYYRAFKDCTSLASIVFKGNAPTISIPASLSSNDDPFYNIAAGCKAYVNEAASGFPAAGEMWHGLTITRIPDRVVVASGILQQTDGGYVVSANDGETLSSEDFSFSAVMGGSVVDTSTGYTISIAANGQSAAVRLKEPLLGAMTVGGKTLMTDISDPSGALVAVEGQELAAKPTAKDGETVGALPIFAVPGLYYQAAWGDDLGNLTSGEKVQATTDTLYLGVIKQMGDKGFYRVTVSEQ